MSDSFEIAAWLFMGCALLALIQALDYRDWYKQLGTSGLPRHQLVSRKLYTHYVHCCGYTTLWFLLAMASFVIAKVIN